MDLLQIELAKANPDIETLKLMFWIAVSIIGLLILIIAYFFKNWYAIIKEQMEKLFQITESIKMTIGNLNTIIEVIKIRQKSEEEFLKEKHEVYDRQLNDHSKRLDNQDNRIVRLETKMNGKL